MPSVAPALSLAGSVFVLAGPALATPTAQLSYARAEGAESCPGTLEVRKAISERLGYDPVDPSSPQIIAAIVEKTPSGFRARVELIADGSTRGLRELSSHGTCAELVSAMALSMSIAIDPERAERGSSSGALPADETASPANANGAPANAGSASAPPAPPSPPPAAAAPPPLPPLRGPEPSASHDERATASHRDGLQLPVDYSLSAFVEVASGFTPGTAAGGALRLRGRHGLFSVSLEGRLDAPTSLDLAGGASVHAGLAALVIAPCLHYGPAFGCALGMGGEVWAGSTAVSDSRSDVALYGALGARLGVDWPERGVWGISLHADGLRPLTQVSIDLSGEQEWAAPALAFAFGGGVVVRF